MPALIIIGIFLYVDRILRQDVIFDSSALTCTVFAIHVLNICRSSIAHIDEVFLQQPLFLQENASLPIFAASSAAAAARQQQHSRDEWHKHIPTAAYCIASILLLLNLDIASIAWPSSKRISTSCFAAFADLEEPMGDPEMQLPCSVGESEAGLDVPANSSSAAAVTMMRPSTIVLHCILVGTIMQVSPVKDVGFMVPWKIMARSFVFTILCIVWTYAVGIHHACVPIRYSSFFCC